MKITIKKISLQWFRENGSVVYNLYDNVEDALKFVKQNNIVDFFVYNDIYESINDQSELELANDQDWFFRNFKIVSRNEIKINRNELTIYESAPTTLKKNTKIANRLKNKKVAVTVEEAKEKTEDAKKVILSDKDEIKKIKSRIDKLLNNYRSRTVLNAYINKNNCDLEWFKELEAVINKMMNNNSKEFEKFETTILEKIINSNNMTKCYITINRVFSENSMPVVGKVFKCFELLFPNFDGLNFKDKTISPVLKGSGNKSRKNIIFSDLIKAAFGSNNRSVNSYIDCILEGSLLYENCINNNFSLNDLNVKEQQLLNKYYKYILSLADNLDKKDMIELNDSDDLFVKIGTLYNIFKINNNSKKAADRIVSMFCHFAGIDSIDEAKAYINGKVIEADKRNRLFAQNGVTLKKGDFIKGIGDIKYLGNLLQNGIVSKEYLGNSATSDCTPLDTDICIVGDEDTIADKLWYTASRSYGPIYIMFKNDDRFEITRTKGKTITDKYNPSKYETFYTGWLGNEHYGIRTGLPSTEIDSLIVKSYDPKIGFEIARNGFYIPVIDTKGNLVFTPEDYDNLRNKMMGLTYYGCNDYKFSDNLVFDGILDIAKDVALNKKETLEKQQKINAVIESAVKDLDLELKTNVDGNINLGYVEFIDTGSTGRGTNKIKEGDFDFMMRLDKSIYYNPKRLSQLKKYVLIKLNKENTNQITYKGDFRLTNVNINNEFEADIDITFTTRNDEVSYSTDMCLADRMNNIYNLDSEKYSYIVANILFAKKVLKDANAYKSYHAATPQGGLGGVGIENWILEYGGSFIDAAKDFLAHAEGKSFSEFVNEYQIWDFGENYMSQRKGTYHYDNFVINNMDRYGYAKMVAALKQFINEYENKKDNEKTYVVK